MAILHENKYKRIIRSTTDFTQNSTQIHLRVYGSAADRDKEKALSAAVNEVKSRIDAHILSLFDNLVVETNKIQAFDTITDGDAFFAAHPNIKALNDEFESVRAEGLNITDGLLYKPIDFETLKHKGLWTSLGLTAEMCKPIQILGEEGLGSGEIQPNDLETLYATIKPAFAGDVKDC